MIELDLVLVCSIHSNKILSFTINTAGSISVSPCDLCLLTYVGDSDPLTKSHSSLILSFSAWADEYCKESWKGYATAFKAGARSAVEGTRCNYSRHDFVAAWHRGYDTMRAFLSEGKTVSIPKSARAEINRPEPCIVMHNSDDLIEDCECDSCMIKKQSRAQQQERLFDTYAS